MKIADLDVADVTATEQKRRLNYYQKYLLLEAGGEVFSLKISDVTDTAIYLKVSDDNE